MNLTVHPWIPSQKRCMVARAWAGEGSPEWLLTVAPTRGGKYMACVERELPEEFLIEGPFDTRTGAKRWAVDQAKELLAAIGNPDETPAGSFVPPGDPAGQAPAGAPETGPSGAPAGPAEAMDDPDDPDSYQDGHPLGWQS